MLKWFPVRIPGIVIVRAFEFFKTACIDAFGQIWFQKLPEIVDEFSI
jgi:hypothetical protein